MKSPEIDRRLLLGLQHRWPATQCRNTAWSHTDVEWVITGRRGSNLTSGSSLPASGARRLGAVLRRCRAHRRGPDGRRASQTLDEAVKQAILAGPFQVRWAALNGINLGLAATQGATASGTTRFTEFDGLLGASSAGIRFEETGGRAGALAARGDFTIAPDHAVAGTCASRAAPAFRR
jgi:hypothetical protein